MGLLDFIKDRNGKPNVAAKSPELNPRITKDDRLFAEIQHDEALARERDITGKEHTTEHGKVPDSLAAERAKGRLEERAKGRTEKAKSNSKGRSHGISF